MPMEHAKPLTVLCAIAMNNDLDCKYVTVQNAPATSVVGAFTGGGVAGASGGEGGGGAGVDLYEYCPYDPVSELPSRQFAVI